MLHGHHRMDEYVYTLTPISYTRSNYLQGANLTKEGDVSFSRRYLDQNRVTYQVSY